MAESKSYDRRTGGSAMFFVSQADSMQLTNGKEGAVMKFVLKINKDITIFIRDQDAIIKLEECIREWRNL